MITKRRRRRNIFIFACFFRNTDWSYKKNLSLSLLLLWFSSFVYVCVRVVLRCQITKYFFGLCILLLFFFSSNITFLVVDWLINLNFYIVFFSWLCVVVLVYFWESRDLVVSTDGYLTRSDSQIQKRNKPKQQQKKYKPSLANSCNSRE